MNRDRQGPMDDGTFHPQLSKPITATNDMVTSGIGYAKNTNPAAVSGSRPDGTANPDLDDSDGFEAEDTTVAGSWGGKPMPPQGINRAGRPEVSGQLERGFVLNQASAGINPPNITEPGVNPGGKIGPA